MSPGYAVTGVLTGCLAVDVLKHDRSEGTVTVKVIADPRVDHGVHRDGGFEGRMRLEERHQGKQTVVGNAGDADAPIVAGHILDEPVDGVPGIGDLIALTAVEGPS